MTLLSLEKPGATSTALGRRLFWWGCATAAATAALILWVDIPLALFFNGYRTTAIVSFFAAITDLANGVIWYSIAVAGIGIAFFRHKTRFAAPNPEAWTRESRAWLFMMTSMATSGVLVILMKLSIGRLRPRFLYRDGEAGFHPFTFAYDSGDYSFPSGHTQSIWSAMVALALLFPWFRVPLLLFASAISASRFITGVHFFGDVVASIFIAVATTLLWRQWFERGGVSVALSRQQ